MYALSASFEVNPPDRAPALTREQLWRGLVLKAEDPLAFVPGMQACRIVERYADGFLREVVLRDVPMRERITLTPMVQVHFLRVDTDHSGWITNVISESNRGLLLTFTFGLNYPGFAAGSPEERARGKSMAANYTHAIDTTLAETRKRVLAGSI
ncbi:MAG: SRPBCC family protein [Burkholderiales bacterium]